MKTIQGKATGRLYSKSRDEYNLCWTAELPSLFLIHSQTFSKTCFRVSPYDDEGGYGFQTDIEGDPLSHTDQSS
jgi:hypothetical protein